MRPSWKERVLATFVAIWFAVMAVEPGALHACPRHDGQVASEHGSGGHGHTQHQCTCIGDCCTLTPAALAAGPVDLPDLPVVATYVASSPEPGVVVAPTQHRLPFANGPPRA
jgi:hypothetical protein